MEDHTTELELKERLSLIESMIAEGRQSSESWGWMFVLWGVAYYLAIAWSALGQGVWAWPVTTLIAAIVTFVGASLKGHDHPETTLGRAIGSIWIALAISLFLLFPALGFSGRLIDLHVFVAVTSAILGMANGASALILRWKAQAACAVVWWGTAGTARFGSGSHIIVAFLVPHFLFQRLF